MMKKILMALVAAGLSVSLQAQNGAPAQFNEATIAQLQAKMRAGTLTSVELTKFYLARIRRTRPERNRRRSQCNH